MGETALQLTQRLASAAAIAIVPRVGAAQLNAAMVQEVAQRSEKQRSPSHPREMPRITPSSAAWGE
jgi:hypothetical protein